MGRPSRSSSMHRRAAADSSARSPRAGAGTGSAPPGGGTVQGGLGPTPAGARSIGQTAEPALRPQVAVGAHHRVRRSRLGVGCPEVEQVTGRGLREALRLQPVSRGPGEVACLPPPTARRWASAMSQQRARRPAPRRAAARHGRPTTTSTAVPAPPRPGPPAEGAHPGAGTVRVPLPRQPLLRRTPAWGRPPATRSLPRAGRTCRYSTGMRGQPGPSPAPQDDCDGASGEGDRQETQARGAHGRRVSSAGGARHTGPRPGRAREVVGAGRHHAPRGGHVLEGPVSRTTLSPVSSSTVTRTPSGLVSAVGRRGLTLVAQEDIRSSRP